MAQELTQIQEQKQELKQKLTALQMLQVKLVEMPLAQLEESIKGEIYDNPALESYSADSETQLNSQSSNDENTFESETYEQKTEREEREDALNFALSSIGSDDLLQAPNYETQSKNSAEYEEIVYGDMVSFYDKLKEQVGEHSLTEQQTEIIEYLIGSLDNNGMLKKDNGTLSDELAIYNNIYVDENEIEDILKILQGFEPAGIGARNLQECLLLQIERKPKSSQKEQMYKVINKYFDSFKKKKWAKIKQSLHINEEELNSLIKELKRLNPKPGASLGETLGRSLQQITPDFTVETNSENEISFYINQGNIPSLRVSNTFIDMLDEYKKKGKSMSKAEKEALLYLKNKTDRAKNYIQAIKQRQETMKKTMSAIIKIQKQFFISGDESDINPMTLKDVSDLTNLDISTISRVSNIKYIDTSWGIFPLKFFFNEKYVTDDGEEMSTRKIKIALKEIINKEDKKHPFSDEKLKDILNKKGFPIARRTVTKYREQINEPVARLRKI